MTSDCILCRRGYTCDVCLDFVHTAHLANGTDHAPECVRCATRARKRSERVTPRRGSR